MAVVTEDREFTLMNKNGYAFGRRAQRTKIVDGRPAKTAGSRSPERNGTSCCPTKSRSGSHALRMNRVGIQDCRTASTAGTMACRALAPSYAGKWVITT